MSLKPVDHKALFDQMPVIRFLVGYESGCFHVAAANDLSAEFFNVNKADVVGQPLDKILSPKNFSHVKASLEVAFKKDRVVTIPALPSSLDNTKMFSFWVNPVKDNVTGEVIFLDVIGKPGETDLGAVERERDDALSLLTSIFDASEVGILVFDSNRRIVKVNDSFERIYGWTKEETLERDFTDFFTSEKKDTAKKLYKKFLKEQKRTSGEVKIFCKDGSIANVIFTTATLKLSHGRQFQVTTIYDITKRKQMEMSLRLAKDQSDVSNNAKSAFLANMSHELRTPLNAIIGFSEMMVTESFGPLGNDKYREYTTDVHSSAKHLLEIINEVLDMSKIESGKLEIDEQEVDLNRLSESLVRVMDVGLLHNNIVIEENYQSDLPRLYADPRLLRQVLMNLVTNSIKYSVNGGTITIETRTNHKDEIELVVIDQGVGIPENRIKDAMEPFGQIHDPHTHSEVYQGTGLGLPLAKAMVEMHGGVFTLKSVEGEGTTVIASFSVGRTRHH